MPKVNIEILRTVTVTRDENAVVELDVPKHILDDEEVLSWVDEIIDKENDGRSLTAKEKAVHAAVTGADWEVADENDETEYNEAYEAD